MPAFLRRVIRIRAEDSPNVKRGLAQRAAGSAPDNLEVVPGVLSWAEYSERRATWDKMRQCVGLDAEFYKGSEVLLFPPEWLMLAGRYGLIDTCRKAHAEAIGIDPAEGGDKTAMAAVNKWGVKSLVSRKTPNTADITGEAIAFGREHNVPPDKWWFDRGGGGTQHADRLRAMGFNVKTVGFGETPNLDPKRGMTMIEERIDIKEDRYVYVNRRAQMYHELSLRFDPSLNPQGFALPQDGAALVELRRQLGLVPKFLTIQGGGSWSMYDAEGRIRMLPKNRKNQSDEPTLSEIMGCSPDEADAVVVAEYGRTFKRRVPTAGAAGF